MRGRPNRVELERVDVPREQMDFVRNRVRPLVAQHLDRALLDLLADAYCQGLTDAVNATALTGEDA
jgi:hypothetical protein